MTLHNVEIASLFNEYADLLDIQGENRFRIRAYRNAAETISTWPDAFAQLVAQGKDLSGIPTIGEDLAEKIAEIVNTGHFKQLDRLEQTLPADLSRMMDINGLGPKRVKALHEQAGIDTIDKLRQAAEQGLIRTLPGFGTRTEANILREIERLAQSRKRWKLSEVEPYAEELKTWLQSRTGVKRVFVAGSYRRRRETVGDLDILVTSEPTHAPQLVRHFSEHEDVKTIVSRGTTRSSVIMRYGLQIDLRVIPDESLGAALHYFTGSRSHNIAIRKRGRQRGLKVNEYGVFRADQCIAGRTEESIYRLFGLQVIPPELRENRGEIEAAEANSLPRLVVRSDLRGDLHCHTSESDGSSNLQDMARAAMRAGLEYLAITDHSQHATIARGLDAGRLSQQIDKIDELNSQFNDFRLLKSCEVDILEDGSLDLDKDILARLDFRLCSIHHLFNLSAKRQTLRLKRAMDNPLCNIIAHPTGRLIGKRAPYALDIEDIISSARQSHCYLEINSSPGRLDLDDVHSRLAKEHGVRLAISSDAHDPTHFQHLRHGVDQARRGWLEKHDILNTGSWKTVCRHLSS